ncbi:MAG TPA: hypothetical protein VM580_14575 [Labilithrix sp.]|jgi:hypothetical protein|nr:hypothetical protein [Labilithrix sp.]
MNTLPRIRLGELDVARLIAGSNPISGFSHGGPERTRAMLAYFTVERIKAHLRDCEAHGIDALVARADPFTMRVLAEYWAEGGTIRWIAQTAPEHREPLRLIKKAKQAGANAIYVHGGEVDRLMSDGRADEIVRQLDAIRALGLPAGVAAHDPANLMELQRLGAPIEFYLVCLYNVSGYRGRTEAEPEERFDDADRAAALTVGRSLDRPCVYYKVYGAGRRTGEDALADVAALIRPCDGVLVGMFPPDHPNIVHENVRRIARLGS